MPALCPPRPPRPILALIRPALGIVVVALGAAMAGCGDDERRDQFYGTDVGMNYQLPDGFLDRTPDTSGDGGDAGETGQTGETGEGVPDAAPAQDAAPGDAADAAAFQDAGEAADTETGG
jgi:hypothetical protein